MESRADPGTPWTVLFWSWLGARTLLWTLVATLTQPNAPLDTVEWLAWGHEWQLGYRKHPPLGAWLGELAFQAGGGALAAVYLLSFLNVALGLVCAWRVARGLLPPHQAQMAGAEIEDHLGGLSRFQVDSLESPEGSDGLGSGRLQVGHIELDHLVPGAVPPIPDLHRNLELLISSHFPR